MTGTTRVVLRAAGFTLPELLVVVVIIGMLAGFWRRGISRRSASRRASPM